MKHWGEPSVDFKKAIEQVMERRRQAVEKKLAPASEEEEGEDIIPMTASRLWLLRRPERRDSNRRMARR